MKKSILALSALSALLSPLALAYPPITIESWENLSADCAFLRPPLVANETKVDYSLDLEIFQDAPETYIKKRCLFNTTVRAPAGYRIKVGRIEFGGNFDQDGDTKGKTTAQYRVLGDSSPVASTGWMINSQPFTVTSPWDSSTPWSSCGGTLKVEGRADASLRSASGSGFGNLQLQNAVGGFYRLNYYCEICPQ